LNAIFRLKYYLLYNQNLLLELFLEILRFLTAKDSCCKRGKIMFSLPLLGTSNPIKHLIPRRTRHEIPFTRIDLQISVKSCFAAAAEGHHPAARWSGDGRHPHLHLRHPRVTFCAGGEKQQQTGSVWLSGQKSQLIWRVVGLTPGGRKGGAGGYWPGRAPSAIFCMLRRQKILRENAEKSKKMAHCPTAELEHIVECIACFSVCAFVAFVVWPGVRWGFWCWRGFYGTRGDECYTAEIMSSNEFDFFQRQGHQL